MKLTDFGLWFKTDDCYRIDGWPEWSKTIPQFDVLYIDFDIYFDGHPVGSYCHDPSLLQLYCDTPRMIKLKSQFPLISKTQSYRCYEINRCLTLDDFDIVPSGDLLEEVSPRVLTPLRKAIMRISLAVH